MYHKLGGAITTWLRYLGSNGEALLSVIRRQFVGNSDTPSGGSRSPPPLAIVLNLCVVLKGELLDEILFLFLDLLQDPAIKELFIEHYKKIYPTLVQHMMLTGDTNIAYKISPQLFSIPALTVPLTRKGGLMDMLLNELVTFFKSISKPNPLTGLYMVDVDNRLLPPSHYYAFTNDITTLLNSPEIAQHMIEHPELLKKLVDTLALMETMNPSVRRTDVHVEYESEVCSTFFD